MDDATKLKMLKHDLQTLTDSNDEYLMTLLSQAEKLMNREGIDTTTDTTDTSISMAIISYAAFLFRKRAAPEGAATAMPKYLRRELTNIAVSQKVAAT